MLFENAKHRSEHIAILNRMTSIISSGSDLLQVFQRLSPEIRRLIDFDRIGIAVPAVDVDGLRVFATDPSEGTVLRRGSEIPLAESASGWVMANKVPLIKSSLEQTEPFLERKMLSAQTNRYQTRLKGRVQIF